MTVQSLRAFNAKYGAAFIQVIKLRNEIKVISKKIQMQKKKSVKLWKTNEVTLFLKYRKDLKTKQQELKEAKSDVDHLRIVWECINEKLIDIFISNFPGLSIRT